MARSFLNQGILGDTGEPASRGFRAIPTDKLTAADYDPRFFETFPTVWAEAYAFRKALEKGDPQKTEEWATLFLLFYFGIIHLKTFDSQTLLNEYDADLWQALHGTYPRPKGDKSNLEFIALLQTDDEVTVGAYYPQVVFFPSRGRSGWAQSEGLKPFLEGNRLSWEKARVLLDDDNYRKEFQQYLLSIPAILPDNSLKENLEKFCQQNFPAFLGNRLSLSPYPQKHPVRAIKTVTEEELLENYPLKRPNGNGGTTYYLLQDLDLSRQPDWVRQKIKNLPAPSAYFTLDKQALSVKHIGKDYKIILHEPNKIELLKDLFLSERPFFCKVSQTSTEFAKRIISNHSVAVKSLSLEPNERAVCLAPLTQEFLRHFPKIFDEQKRIKAEPDTEGGVLWTFPIGDKEISYYCHPTISPALPTTTLSLYPPQVAKLWKLYLGYGTGSNWRWHLIDENGTRNKPIELDEEQYISYLHREGDAPNRPKALLLTDATQNPKERGVLFLSELDDVDVEQNRTATLAVDFGTSNTCLAFKTSNTATPEIVKFNLTSLPLWGEPAKFETPGNIPLKWGGQKGFFPTILLSRKDDEQLPKTNSNNLELQHLFKVDIPGLHRELNQKLVTGDLNKQWRVHSDLKWSSDEQAPWRSLFLELILLYAHAEIFFTKKYLVNEYKFTFPLAFSETYGNTYHQKAKGAIQRIRSYCFGEDKTKELNDNKEYSKVSESKAVAYSVQQDEGSQGLIEVFLDIGGGTADIAIRHEKEFLVLDSVRIAGKTFFNFAKKSFDKQKKVAGASEFKTNLGRLLYGRAEELNIEHIEGELKDNLGAFYAIEINELDENTFTEREESVLQQGMGAVSYQKYRSRLFFRHLFAYALMQVCAVVIDHKIQPKNGINFYLGGNGWGLLLFAGLPRQSRRLKSEIEHILQKLVERLSKSADEEEKQVLENLRVNAVELLNQENLSDAKTSVARGALQTSEIEKTSGDAPPYAGVTVAEMKINNFAPRTVRWCERWSYETFRKYFGFFETITNRDFSEPENLNQPFSETLSIFTALGNTADIGADVEIDGFWTKVNTQINGSLQKFNVDGERLSIQVSEKESISFTPLNYFLSEVLYSQKVADTLLDKLAEDNLSSGSKKED